MKFDVYASGTLTYKVTGLVELEWDKVPAVTEHRWASWGNGRGAAPMGAL